MKTFMLQDPSGQLFVTQLFNKVYCNDEYKVYRNTSHEEELLVLRKKDKMTAFVESWEDLTNPVNFKYKLNGVF